MGTQDDLQRARAGDSDANNATALRIRGAVNGVICRSRWASLRPTKEDEEDLVQQVTAVVLRILPRFEYRTKGSLEAYSRQVADLSLHDIEKIANAKKRRPGKNAHADDEVLEAHHSPNANTQRTPSSDLIRKERIQHVLKALSLIPEMEGRALRMQHWEGLKVHEIAARSGIDEDAAKKLLAQARVHLKKLLDSDRAP